MHVEGYTNSDSAAKAANAGVQPEKDASSLWSI